MLMVSPLPPSLPPSTLSLVSFPPPHPPCAFPSSRAQALALDDADFAVHKWFAITLKDLGDYEGSKVGRWLR